MDYVGTYPCAGVGLARCLVETEGFAITIAHSQTDYMLGVDIIGARASEIIAERVLAMEFGASSEDIARTVQGLQPSWKHGMKPPWRQGSARFQHHRVAKKYNIK